MQNYVSEQNEIETKISELSSVVENNTEEIISADKFIKIIKKYQNFDELTDEMIYEFIDRIEVHAPVGKSRGKRTQRIDICFIFIGKY